MTILLGACQQIDVVVEPRPVDGAIMDADVAMDAADTSVADADTGLPPTDSGTDADADEDDGGPIPDDTCPYRRELAPGNTAAVRDLVASGLEHAICACMGYSSSAGLTVDRLDGTPGGDLGVNEGFDVQASAMVGGSLLVAGGDGLSLGPNVQLTVGSDLEIGGPLEGAEASVAVARDARVAGRIDLIDLQVVGALRHTPGETLQVVNTPRLGELISTEVQVSPPCACDAAQLLDVPTLVRDTMPNVTPLDSPVIPTERCGQYALDGGAVDTLVLAVSESAALYVSGNLHLDELTIDVAAGAELDLFVEGNLVVNGPVELGSAAGGAVRVHVGAAGTLVLGQGGTLYGALYAPLSELLLNGGALDVRGSLLVNRVAAFASVVVHFDPSVAAP